MNYRDKTYVAFDGDHDIRYYELMKAWKQNKHIDFNFYDAHDLNTANDSSQTESIKRDLAIRMANSKMFILLLGEHTKRLTRFVKWEVEHAKFLKLPIIVVNLNNRRDVDTANMPSWLDDYPSISCSFNVEIVKYSLDNWGKYHLQCLKDNKNSYYCWRKSVYAELGL